MSYTSTPIKDLPAMEKFLPLEKVSFIRRTWEKTKTGVLSILGILLFLGFWEVQSRYIQWIEPFFIPPFSDVARELWKGLANLQIPTNLIWSFRNYLVGYLIAIATAVPLGLAMGSFPVVNRLLSPYLWIGFVMPRLAFIPVIIIAMGFGPEGKILLIFISCFFPIIINTIAGVQTVSPSLVKVGRLFGGSKLLIYRKIILPYAINFVLTGMRIAARTGLVVMYATEIFGSSAGLGYWVILQTDVFNMAGGFAGVLVLVITAITALSIFDFLDNLFRPWKSEVAF